MMKMVNRYSWLAVIAGYAVVYMNKGFDRVLIDIQSITPEKLIEKWQNFAVAAVAVIAIGFVKKMKLPTALKTLLIIALYFIAGHQIGTAIDPPYYGGTSQGTMVMNPYRGA
jgi:hypothetical protein